MKIELKRFTNEDAEDLAKISNNKNISDNLRNAFPSPYSIEDAKLFIASAINSKDLIYKITVDGKLAGCISVSKKDDIYEKTGELGYFLDQKFWNKGIMTKAISLILPEAFDSLDVIRIEAVPMGKNKASQRVLEKSGFTREAEIPMSVFKNGEFDSYIIYSIFSKDVENASKKK